MNRNTRQASELREFKEDTRRWIAPEKPTWFYQRLQFDLPTQRMPAIPLQWMDSTRWHQEPLDWAAYVYGLLAPRVNVKGRMALVLLSTVLCAFFWLLWRAYTVIQTPNDVLVDKLGLDIPPEPLVTLEEVSSRQIQISWKAAELTTSIQEHHVEVNGKVIGITKKLETAAVIYNLSPGNPYDIRIFSVSPGRFQTPSGLLHVKTSTSSSASSQDGNNDGQPAVRPLAPRLPPTPSVLTAPAMARELSAAQPLVRRGTNGRKPSPSGHTDTINGSVEVSQRDMEEESFESLAELSQQFQRMTTEAESIEGQTQDDEKEYLAAAKEREARLEAVKLEMKERDEASNELKRQVHRAEAENRSKLSEKSKKERQLKEKENSRRKRKDEMVKWEEQSQSMAEEIEGINKQKDAIRRRTESEIREIKQKNTEEQREVAQLEEENKEKALLLKELQEERKENNPDEETEESRLADREDQERDERFRSMLNALNQNYARVWNDLNRANHEYTIALQRKSMYEPDRRPTAVSFAPVTQTGIDDMRRATIKPIRRPRHASSHGSNVSSPTTAFGPEPFSSFNNAVTVSASPSNQPHQAPFFNAQNGMTLVLDLPPVTLEEDEVMTSAPMSPRADSLLPHNLLGDESADELAEEPEVHSKSNAGDSASGRFVSLGPPSIREEKEYPASPSTDSSSPRSYSSPREGLVREVDSDQHSSQSGKQPAEESVEPGSGHKKLSSMSNLFSFNRQRGKTLANQPPLLGSLKSGQSQSFPRNFDEFDPSAPPRRRLSYSSTWQFPGSNLITRNHSERDSDHTRGSAARRAFPNLIPGLGRSSATRSYDPFAPRTNSFDPGLRGETASPRPASTYSFDKLPRPSMEDQFRAWGYEKPGLRNSPLAPDWGSTISRNHSRRPSVGYGSTSNLSLQVPDDDGEFIEPHRESRPLQAPIGTRPASSQRPSTPKLNPNAPAFTMFGFGKNKDKTKEKTKTKDSKGFDGFESASPPESRKSKDTHSIAATTSTFESRDSLERTTSGLSNGASLETTPSSSKPTFISKITRKASSNKFGSWKDKSSLFSSRRDPPTPSGDTEDEHGSFEHLGKSIESAVSTPGVDDKKGSRTSLGSWNFMRKKPKSGKEDLTASEISENGELVSEAGDESRDEEQYQ